MLRLPSWLVALSPILLMRCVTSSCTAIGCGIPFQVRFTGSTEKPGRYRVDVVADGVASWCEVSLPWTCEAITPACSAPQSSWGLSTSGCGMVPESVEGIMFHSGAPSTVELVVRRDDEIVGQGSMRPQYVESHPNGPDCDPACRTAPASEMALAP